MFEELQEQLEQTPGIAAIELKEKDRDNGRATIIVSVNADRVQKELADIRLYGHSIVGVTVTDPHSEALNMQFHEFDPDQTTTFAGNMEVTAVKDYIIKSLERLKKYQKQMDELAAQRGISAENLEVGKNKIREAYLLEFPPEIHLHSPVTFE